MSAQVMVPLDGSVFAEQALPLALLMARRMEGRLHLVRVRAALPLATDGEVEEEYLARIEEQLETELPDRITHSVRTNELGPLDYPPPPSNVVADVLTRHAIERDVALVVMTTHGRGGLRRTWLGSVADALIRIAPRPVLVLRPNDETADTAALASRGFHHILVPLDGSQAAEGAMRYAQQLGDPFGARYTLVRVVSPLAYGVFGPYGSPDEPHPPLFNRQAALDYLERVAGPMREKYFLVATQVLQGLSAAPTILDYAQSNGVDVIVLSTSGAGGMRRLLLGSVADKIVRSGEVPVLVCNVRHLDEAAPNLMAARAAAAS